MRKQRRTTPLSIRLWRKIDIKGIDDCWEWLGAISPATGYGHIGVGRRGEGVTTVHAAVYEDVYGEIMNGMVICHYCNNPKCANPKHLYEGTYGDNIRQAWKDGLRDREKCSKKMKEIWRKMRAA